MRTSLPSVRHALDPQSAPADQLGPGAEVEIWCRSLGTWSPGFVAVDVDADGWRVVRRSDGARLPVRFAERDVRPADGVRRL